MITIPPGVFDILPSAQEKNQWRNSSIWNFVESIVRETAKDFGYQEIRTPIFERTELFVRGVGETSDIVTKEMYTFQDKGDRSMTLRPEGTAPVMRSFVENQLHMVSPVTKLFYIGPMFRYERPQSGRYRQHHQFGVEVIGVASPEQDAEIIAMLYTLYSRLGLKNLKVHINSIGDKIARESFKTELQNYYRKFLHELSADSKVRYEKNPLRILDSKDPNDIKINEQAPSILKFLSDESLKHFETMQNLLTALNIPFAINDKLVRGLDYYNKTVFEITAGELGAQNSIGAGGRYDGLLKTIGGPDLPSIGFGTGIERIIQTMLGQGIALPKNFKLDLFIIPLGDDAKKASFSLLHKLRQSGISTEMDFSGKKLNKVMQYANQIGVKHVVVIGENELKIGIVELKNMETGLIDKIPLENLKRILKIESTTDNFVHLWKELSQPFEHQSEADFFTKKISQIISETKNLSSTLLKSLDTIQGILK
jgi:histidyl-tRNA synthetase